MTLRDMQFEQTVSVIEKIVAALNARLGVTCPEWQEIEWPCRFTTEVLKDGTHALVYPWGWPSNGQSMIYMHIAPEAICYGYGRVSGAVSAPHIRLTENGASLDFKFDVSSRNLELSGNLTDALTPSSTAASDRHVSPPL